MSHKPYTIMFSYVFWALGCVWNCKHNLWHQFRLKLFGLKLFVYSERAPQFTYIVCCKNPVAIFSRRKGQRLLQEGPLKKFQGFAKDSRRGRSVVFRSHSVIQAFIHSSGGAILSPIADKLCFGLTPGIEHGTY